jgi:integrase
MSGHLNARTPNAKACQQCSHLGASQGDIANLKGEDVDWANNTVSFFRKKAGVPGLVHLGAEALNLFKDCNHRRPEIHRQQFWLRVAL